MTSVISQSCLFDGAKAYTEEEYDTQFDRLYTKASSLMQKVASASKEIYSLDRNIYKRHQLCSKVTQWLDFDKLFTRNIAWIRVSHYYLQKSYESNTYTLH